MAELKIYISRDLNEKFRRIAMTVYGYGRGSISKAAEEALTKWCKGQEPSTSEAATPAEHSDVSLSQEGKTASRINPEERTDVIETPNPGEDKLPLGSKSSS